MPYGLYLSAEGAHAQSKRLEVVANNMANVDTPGFKRDLAVFQARLAEATQRGLDHPGSGTINDLGGGIEVRQSKTDFSPGTLRRTGFDKDMAIDGDGFFVVQKDAKNYLTRAGNFMVNAANQLVTQSGHRVQSDSGAPVLIDPEAGPWQLTPDGAVVQAGTATNLAIVRPRSPGDLAKVGENMFQPLAPTQPVEPTERHVLSGYLEGSTVRPTLEMMELIEASRGFEANTNMIHHQDQIMGTLINRILKEG
jgi:flagellar basal-body rod protein FlgF/flagellar basal-body rod protein FlgG